jgi:hypothetical protein
MKIHDKEIGWPLIVSAAVAFISVLAFLIIEFGPWTRQAPDKEATKAAAQAVGAKVTPTQPKLAVEPTPPGPQPIQPPAPTAWN